MMNPKIFSLSLLIVFLSFELMDAQVVNRGPYLQSPTDKSIILRWRTDVATESRVIYGTDENNLSSTATGTGTTTEHTVHITGLSPFTRYYYAVGNAGQLLSGPDNKHYFTTNPVPGTVQPIRAWAIGDMGKNNQGQRDVRDSYIDFTGNTHTDVWLWMGDNAYNDGTQAEYQERVFDIYPELFTYMPFWPTPGNHDYISVCAIPCNQDPQTLTGPYLDIVDVPTNGEAGGVPSGTEHYYSFDYGNVHFISLNSELGSLTSAWDYIGVQSKSNATNSPLMQWLRADLEANTRDWTVVYWHQCPYSKGSHDTDDFWELYIKAMRENIVPVLEEYGVDMVITGHSHVYERSYLIHGHYGNSSGFNSTHKVDGSSGRMADGEPYVKTMTGPDSSKGTVYVVIGNSGSSTSNPALNHPAMFYSHGCGSCYGSFVLDINGNRLDGMYLTSQGEILDEFTMMKDGVSAVEKIESPVSNIKIYPNPFSQSTQIEYHLARKTNIAIQLYDITGKWITTLVDEKKKDAGTYYETIDAGKLSLAKNIYVVKIQTDGKETVQRIVKMH